MSVLCRLDLLEVHRELLEHVGCDRRGERRFACRDPLDRANDLRDVGTLDDVARRARPEHLEHCGAILVRRKGNHARTGTAGTDVSNKAWPAAGDLEVDERDVRLLAHRDREP